MVIQNSHFLFECLLDKWSSPGQRKILLIAHYKNTRHPTLHNPITQDSVQEPRGKEIKKKIQPEENALQHPMCLME